MFQTVCKVSTSSYLNLSRVTSLYKVSDASPISRTSGNTLCLHHLIGGFLHRNLNRFLEIQLIGNPRKRSKASLFFGGSAFGMDEETEKSLASMDLTDVYGLHDEPLKKDKTPISWDPPKDYLQVVVDRQAPEYNLSFFPLQFIFCSD